MADYYPLLAKAVAGLPNASLDARRAIYERARKALFNQLRSLDPPVPETVVEAEARDLETAVARLEAELASRPDPSTATDPVVAPPKDEVAGDAAPAPAPLPPQKEVPESAPALDNKCEPTGTPPVESNAVALEPLPPEKGDAGLDTDPAIAVLGTPEDATPSGGAPGESASSPPLPPRRPKAESQRPVAPKRAVASAPSRRLWVVGAAIMIVVALVASFAYMLRDHPEEIMARQAVAPPAGAEPAGAGKIVDRIGSGETTPPPAPPIAAKKVETVKSRVEPVLPPAAVASRAALLIEAPDEQNKVKTLLGTVVWRLDNVSNGPGEPLSLAVRADIDIPEEKLQTEMMFQKNFDSTLPASHTLKLRFSIPPESDLGGVKQISVPQMRREDTATGESLKGVPVTVMENSFLVGLARGPAEAPNIELLKSREWFDVPILLNNGRIAKLTFEKGTSGQAALEDALASWSAQ
jgi:hypothetical protein